MWLLDRLRSDQIKCWSTIATGLKFYVVVLTAGVPLLSAVMQAAMTQLKDFTPQAIKDTLWAFATLGFTPNNSFLQGSVDQCLVLIAQFNPQNIANAIWAFAKFSYHPGRYACTP